MKMKKLLALVLSISLLFAVAGCSSDNRSESQAPSTQPEPESEDVNSFEDLDGLDVEQNLFDVEITIPASFLEDGITQEELDAEVKESGFHSATLNEDGSATYVMTKEQHKQMMTEIKRTIDQSLEEMIDPETYPTFVEIKANDDYSNFTVKTTAETLGMTEAFSVLAFYVCGGMYHAFNGAQVDDISVIFVNADTGEVIEESHSSDVE